MSRFSVSLIFIYLVCGCTQQPYHDHNGLTSQHLGASDYYYIDLDEVNDDFSAIYQHKESILLKPHRAVELTTHKKVVVTNTAVFVFVAKPQHVVYIYNRQGDYQQQIRLEDYDVGQVVGFDYNPTKGELLIVDNKSKQLLSFSEQGALQYKKDLAFHLIASAFLVEQQQHIFYKLEVDAEQNIAHQVLVTDYNLDTIRHFTLPASLSTTPSPAHAKAASLFCNTDGIYFSHLDDGTIYHLSMTEGIQIFFKIPGIDANEESISHYKVRDDLVWVRKFIFNRNYSILYSLSQKKGWVIQNAIPIENFGPELQFVYSVPHYEQQDGWLSVYNQKSLQTFLEHVDPDKLPAGLNSIMPQWLILKYNYDLSFFAEHGNPDLTALFPDFTPAAVYHDQPTKLEIDIFPVPATTAVNYQFPTKNLQIGQGKLRLFSLHGLQEERTINFDNAQSIKGEFDLTQIAGNFAALVLFDDQNRIIAQRKIILHQ